MSDNNRSQSIEATGSFKLVYRLAALLSMAVLPIFVPTLQANDNCQHLINNRIYDCRVKDDDGLTFRDCFRFKSPGKQSENFDLSLDLFPSPGVLACDCQGDGDFFDPEFGNTDSLHCVSTVTSLFGLALHGDVKRNGRKIAGQAIDEIGDSYVFHCKQVQSCEVSVSTEGATSRGW